MDGENRLGDWIMVDLESMLARQAALNEIGIALSAEQDINRLLEKILFGAKKITNADGGTLYSVDQEKGEVRMEIVSTDSMNFAMGGTSGKPIPFPPIPLHDEQGKPNEQMVVTHAVLNDTLVNIPDAYAAEGFDFSGTRRFDEKTGYRSQSFLTVPLKNHENDIIAVMQLLNAREEGGERVIPFSTEAEQLALSLASQAAIAITNRRLINDLNKLLESLIQLIASAIDQKSPYTGGHCRRVPVLTMLLADEAHNAKDGPLKDFCMTPEDRHELEIAAWLHDCGKITTPEYVVDKATKLETIYNRLETVRTRFEVLRRDAEIASLKQRLAAAERGQPLDSAALDGELQGELEQIDEALRFVERHNTGGEFMRPEDQQRIREIGQRRLRIDGKEHPLLSDDEIYNLTIAKGTLTPEEREIINHHIVATIDMLEALHFPKHLQNVPEFAGGHHERMDGKGYPRGLTRDQMSVQARVMAIADVFEALTAKDRPYKEGMPLSKALSILGRMKEDHHIDPDLFDIFIRHRVFEKYAAEYLDDAQRDQVDLASLPGRPMG
jgi:HD-GYP domain-containing protein (c-di-GMP phosphodiesterase class II)